MRLLNKRWPWISLVVFVCLVGLGFLGYRELDRRWQEMLESKWVRTTIATVIRKESFRCEEKSCFYTSGYGDRVEMKQGDSQQRIYYRIENFDQVDEPRRSRAMEAEKKRVQDSGPRFTYAADWYDKVEPGDHVYVQYRCFNDGQIQVWGVDIRGRSVSAAKSNKGLQLTAIASFSSNLPLSLNADRAPHVKAVVSCSR